MFFQLGDLLIDRLFARRAIHPGRGKAQARKAIYWFFAAARTLPGYFNAAGRDKKLKSFLDVYSGYEAINGDIP